MTIVHSRIAIHASARLLKRILDAEGHLIGTDLGWSIGALGNG
jgi:hypothetical protein